VPYNVDPARVRFEKYSFQSLSTLQQQGFYLIIISNQPGISLGYFNGEDLKKLEQKLKELLLDKDIRLDGFYYCPHSPEDSCNCRKPKPGLIFKAAKDMEIDLSQSWMIGDILNDVEAGRRSQCKTILIDNGNETEWTLNPYRMPHYIAKDLKEAATFIMLDLE
jgi:histidinol-phosphate phosphatase family protein